MRPKISLKVTRLLFILSSTRLFFYVLLYLMLLLVAGTIAQAEIGLYLARKIFFSSIVLWAGPIPLPGGATTLGLLALGLFTKLGFRSSYSLKRAGILLSHWGALLLLLSGLVLSFTREEGMMVISEGTSSNRVEDIETHKTKFKLPFQLYLLDFIKEYYPASSTVKSYRSVVLVMDGKLSERRIIQMNQPLYYKEYIFYQSSYEELGFGNRKLERTILTVVKDRARLFPYFGSFVLVLGLFISLFQRFPQFFSGKKEE